VVERAKVDEFLQPKAMLTPGIAGGVTMLIANALWVAFSLPPRWTSLVLSFVVGLLVFVGRGGGVPGWQRAVYYLLNSLIIFSVSIGANYVGVGVTHPPAPETRAAEPTAPTGARQFFGDWLRAGS
jgi:hypothetical protein